jgi:hypothetical protein
LRARIGKPSEARAAVASALAIQHALEKAQPGDIRMRRDLAFAHAACGRLARELGRFLDAASSHRRAIAIEERLPAASPSDYFNLASYRAALAGKASHDGSGVAATEGESEAARAMQGLRQAIAVGYNNLGEVRSEINLDSLRSRPDFRILLLDAVKPANPFAKP